MIKTTQTIEEIMGAGCRVPQKRVLEKRPPAGTKTARGPRKNPRQASKIGDPQETMGSQPKKMAWRGDVETLQRRGYVFCIQSIYLWYLESQFVSPKDGYKMVQVFL